MVSLIHSMIKTLNSAALTQSPARILHSRFIVLIILFAQFFLQNCNVSMAHKYALMVGCNYPNTVYQLRGCINDANSMHDILIKRFGFKETNVELLTDDPEKAASSDQNKPTASNIKATLNKFFSGAKSGDVVFFFFAGHGTIIPRQLSSSGKDEQAIVTCDNNMITSMDFREILNGVPDGITFVLMPDSCNSGGLIDKETEQIGPDINRQVVLPTLYRPRFIPFAVVLEQHSLLHSTDPVTIQTQLTQLFGSDASLAFRDIPYDQLKQPLRADQGILLSASQPDELASEDMFDGSGIYHGAFTWAVLNVLEDHSESITNRHLVKRARKFIKKLKTENDQHLNQHPCLYCSDHNANAVFLNQG